MVWVVEKAYIELQLCWQGGFLCSFILNGISFSEAFLRDRCLLLFVDIHLSSQ